MKFVSWIPAAIATSVVCLAACSSEPLPEVDGDPVRIEAFAADPEVLEIGESTLISWVTRDAWSVRITDDEGGLIDLEEQRIDFGTKTLRPRRTTTYTLAAKGASGAEVYRELVVRIDSTPPKIEFKAEKERIEVGGATKLKWKVGNATRVELRHGTSAIFRDGEKSGSFEVKPEHTTTYTIEAEGPGGHSSAEVKVEVAASILAFYARPEPPIPVNAEITVSWSTVGADSLVLADAKEFQVEIPEDRIALGSWTLPPASPQPFRLIARRDEVITEKELSPELLSAPAIETFVVEPTLVTATRESPATVEVSWKVDDADSVVLETDDSLLVLDGPEGRIEVEVVGSTAFALLARNAAGEASAKAAVESIAPPVIVSFESSTPHLGIGERFRLSWKTSDAIAVSLQRDGVDLATGPLATSDEKTLQATGSATYLLTARNAAGAEVRQALEVTVGPPIIERFEPDFDPAAPGERIRLGWIVRGATSVRIEDSECTNSADATLPVGGCELTVPDEVGEAEFQLVATNSSGETVADTQVEVIADPIVRRFTASPGRISTGESVTLSWSVVGPTPVHLELRDSHPLGIPYDLGALEDAPEGSLELILPAAGPETFTLTATAPGYGTAIGTATVEVFARPTVSFASIPPIYDPELASRVQLTWDASDAVRISLYALDEEGAPILPAIRVTDRSSGSIDAAPTTETTYRLVAENEAGGITEADVVVPVVRPVIDDFTPSSFTVAAGGKVTLSWATSNGEVSLSPALEITGAAPLVDLSGSGAPFSPGGCGTSMPLDEGCGIISFPDGFLFPYAGVPRAAVRIFVNGFVSFAVEAEPGATALPHPLPSVPHAFVHLAPFWSNLSLDPTIAPTAAIFTELRALPEGRALFIQWRDAFDPKLRDLYSVDSSFNLQLVLWESGAFEYRYGSMSAGVDTQLGVDHQPRADGQNVTIGHQGPTSSFGYNLNGGAALPGGLSHRSWRMAESAPSTGSIEVTVHETTSFELCVTRAGWMKSCRSTTVLVP